MVRSGGGIEWLILIYIYYTQIYVTLYNLKCIANFESQKLLQNSMLWRSTCFYIVTFVHWNIMFIESCMYKSVLGKKKKKVKKKTKKQKNYWWQKSDIWSQASYRYPISWEACLDPSDSYFLFAEFVDFYTHLTYICICTFFVTFF